MPIDSHTDPLTLPSYLCGEAVADGPGIEVHYPWDNSLTGTVSLV